MTSPTLPTSPTSMRQVSALLVALSCLAMACDRSAEPGAVIATPSATAMPAPWFCDVTDESGIRFTYESGHVTRNFLLEMVGGGVALFDMDGDGDLDAFFPQGGRIIDPLPDPPKSKLFRNRGDGHFDDVSAESGAALAGSAMGVACGDVDDDGDSDLFVTRYGRPSLLRNDGTGHFADVTEAAGLDVSLWGTSAAFVDIDRDGDLDLYVANYVDWSVDREQVCYNEMGSQDYCGPRSYAAPTADLLFRNDGGGRFQNVTKQAGIDQAKGNGLGVVCADFDGDGWQDIFVANDGTPNFLWVNQRDGTFKEKGMLLGCAVDEDGTAKAGMGVSAEDVDGDDDIDLIVGNLFGETDSYFSWDGQYFKDATRSAGLIQRPKMFTRFAMILADFDDDGCLDLFEANGRVMRHATTWSADPYAEPNLVFSGACNGIFTELKPEGATATPLIASSRGAAQGDLDGDGALDLIVVNRDAPVSVLRNVVAPRGGSLSLRVLERSGRDALGATVRFTAGGRKLRRDVRAAASYVSSVDPSVHIGLGSAAGVEGLEVTWVDGAKEAFGDAEAGRVLTLQRGKGHAR